MKSENRAGAQAPTSFSAFKGSKISHFLYLFAISIRDHLCSTYKFIFYPLSSNLGTILGSAWDPIFNIFLVVPPIVGKPQINPNFLCPGGFSTDK